MDFALSGKQKTPYCSACTASFVLFFAASVQAQPYPNKPIRMIVISAPGGSTDILSRALGRSLSESMGQTVVLDNKPGGGGIIATETTAKAPPDGYTILMGTIGGLAVAGALNPKLGYDTLRDFAPITQTVTITSILVVPASTTVTTLPALIDAARAAPGKLTYATTGPGTTPYLAGELMKSMAGLQILQIPYKGSGAALTALLRGEVDINFENSLIVLPHLKSGKLRALAVTSAQRSPLLPELPTMHEAGLPGFAATGWYGLLAPAGTPPEIINRLHAAATQTLATKEVQERLSSQGAEIAGSTPQAFTQFIRAETDKWTKLVRTAGLKPE